MREFDSAQKLANHIDRTLWPTGVSLKGWFSEKNYRYGARHEVVKLGEELLHLKMPYVVGEIITSFRMLSEARWNNSLLVAETSRDMLKREQGTIEKLRSERFHTYAPRQDLFEQTSLKGPCLITTHIPRLENLVDIIKNSSQNEQYNYVCRASLLLKQLHQFDTIAGDAWLGNFCVNSQGSFLYGDFGLKPNPVLLHEIHKAHDLLTLTASAAYRSTLSPQDLLGAIGEAYGPLPSSRYFDVFATGDQGLVADMTYFKPVWGVSSKTRSEMASALSHRAR